MSILLGGAGSVSISLERRFIRLRLDPGNGTRRRYWRRAISVTHPWRLRLSPATCAPGQPLRRPQRLSPSYGVRYRPGSWKGAITLGRAGWPVAASGKLELSQAVNPKPARSASATGSPNHDLANLCGGRKGSHSSRGAAEGRPPLDNSEKVSSGT